MTKEEYAMKQAAQSGSSNAAQSAAPVAAPPEQPSYAPQSAADTPPAAPQPNASTYYYDAPETSQPDITAPSDIFSNDYGTAGLSQDEEY